MSSTGAGYDQSSTTFSPDGRLFQVEYANKAVETSGTAIGLKCKDGIVLAVENLQISKMLVPGTNRRIFTVGPNLGIALTGLTADGRQIVNQARDEVAKYKDNYGTPMPPAVLADRLAQYVHYYTLHGSVRPFGSAAILAGYDEFKDVAELYMIEPSGTNYKYYGAAVGKGKQGAKTEIEKMKLTETTVDQAVKEVAKILHKLHDESKDKPFELEMSWITANTKWEHTPLSKDAIEQAESWAKAAIEAEDMDESDDEK